MSAISAEVQPLPAAEATAPEPPAKCYELGHDIHGHAMVCWKSAGHKEAGDPWHRMLPMTAPIPIRRRT